MTLSLYKSSTIVVIVVVGGVVVVILLIPVIIYIFALITLTHKLLHATKTASYFTRAHDTAI